MLKDKVPFAYEPDISWSHHEYNPNTDEVPPTHATAKETWVDENASTNPFPSTHAHHNETERTHQERTKKITDDADNRADNRADKNDKQSGSIDTEATGTGTGRSTASA